MEVMKSRIAAVAVGSLVVVGLGAGGAVAGSLITSADIRNQTIQSSDIGPDGVGKSEVRDDAVGWRELNDNAKGQVESYAGSDGVNGTDGADGADGVSGYQVFTGTPEFGSDGVGGTSCGTPDTNTADQVWRVLGGGAYVSEGDVNNGVALVGSWPTEDPLNPSWSVQVNKPAGVEVGEITVYAVCVKVPTPPAAPTTP